MDTRIAQTALEVASGYTQGAAKDRTLQAFFAGVAAADPTKISMTEALALAMSGQPVVERWAGVEPSQQHQSQHGPSSNHG